MSKDRTPRSAREWKDLPELPMKAIANEREKGSVYQVLKVGVYRASYDELPDAGVERPPGDGWMPLPTVTVQAEDGARLYRLPDTLNEWAFDAVALAVAGTRRFPCEVEFGTNRGRPYAEFVVKPPNKMN